MKNFILSLCFLFPSLQVAYASEREEGLSVRDPIEIEDKNNYDKYLKRCFAGDKEAQNLLFQYHNKQFQKLSKLEPFIDPLYYDNLAIYYNNLGFFYKNGWGCEKDEKKAVDYFQKAVYQGCPISYFNLSVMYSNGRGGLDPDQEMAFLLFVEGLKKHPQLAFFFQGLGELKKGKKAFLSWLSSSSNFFQDELSRLISREQTYAYFETFISFFKENKENEILQTIADMGWVSSRLPLSLRDFTSILKSILDLANDKAIPQEK